MPALSNSSLSEKKFVVLVSGTGSNLQALIDATQKQEIKSQLSCVLSNRVGVPALQKAQVAGIPTRVIVSREKKNEDFFSELETALSSENPDFIVLAGFMRILPPPIVKKFSGRILNIHPSLLPQFPGKNAIEQAFAAKVKITGCTVHIVDEGCDTGPILLQKEVEILPADTLESLAARIHSAEHALLVQAVQNLEKTLA